MRIKDEWMIEYIQFKDEYFKRNEGIYEIFSKKQNNIIKGYFKWRTIVMFKKICGDLTLGVSSSKTQRMAEEFGYTDDWEYAGCVDTGYFGASNCAFGHALRYEHYARSEELGLSVVFGSKCASDFFEIGADKLMAINKAQASVIEEIKFIHFIMATDKRKEYFYNYYGDLGKIVEVLSDRLDETFSKGWNIQIANFLTGGLPLTESMVRRIDYVKKRYYTQRLEEITRLELVKSKDYINPKYFEVIKDETIYYNKLSLAHMWILTKNNVNDVAEKVSRLTVSINNTRDQLMETFGDYASDYGDLIYAIEKYRDIVDATKHEVKLLLCFMWALSGKERLIRELKVPTFGFNEVAEVQDITNIIAEVVKFSELPRFYEVWDKFISIDIENERITDKSLELKVTEIENAFKGTSTNDTRITIALDLCNKYRVYRENTVFSSKQEAILEYAYNKAMKIGDVIEDRRIGIAKKVVEFQRELIEKDKVNNLTSEEEQFLRKMDFHLQIANTVANNLRCSEKQEKYLDSAYESMKDIINNRNLVDEVIEPTENTEPIELIEPKIVDIGEVERDNRGVDKKSITNFGELFNTDDEDDEVEEVAIIKEGVKSIDIDEELFKGYEKTGIPNVIEMSEALAKGIVKVED